ncbi:uncharacterized protein LOC121855337 [Homarus americanus]|uniref:uncharacterized protein LOC121855337 n=1 Tax=Homarus americanus TaxID=6706 RepID=UPI001C46739D|nr:uncharacterized protein LOC121855337 [Homarus americanus]
MGLGALTVWLGTGLGATVWLGMVGVAHCLAVHGGAGGSLFTQWLRSLPGWVRWLAGPPSGRVRWLAGPLSGWVRWLWANNWSVRCGWRLTAPAGYGGWGSLSGWHGGWGLTVWLGTVAGCPMSGCMVVRPTARLGTVLGAHCLAGYAAGGAHCLAGYGGWGPTVWLGTVAKCLLSGCGYGGWGSPPRLGTVAAGPTAWPGTVAGGSLAGYENKGPIVWLGHGGQGLTVCQYGIMGLPGWVRWLGAGWVRE